MQSNEELLSSYSPIAQSSLWSILFCCIIHALSYYMLFRKAGLPGWKALIPFYSLYLRFRLAWKTIWLWVTCAALLLLVVTACSSSVAAALLSCFSLLLCIGLEIALQFHMGRAFGWGVFPSILLGFINPILLPVLGFFSKSYLGSRQPSARKDSE